MVLDQNDFTRSGMYHLDKTIKLNLTIISLELKLAKQ